MATNEIILHVAAEGGGITLYGLRNGMGWLFSREVIDQTPELLDEPWIQHESEVVSTWQDALELLDKYPWYCLCPPVVHPKFRQALYAAVISRDKAKVRGASRRMSDWKHLCSETG